MPRWPSAIVQRQGRSPRARRSRSTAPPRFRRFSLSALHGEHDFLPCVEGADAHQRGRFGSLQSGLHIQAIAPDLHDFQVVQPALLPGLIAQLPSRLQPGEGGR